MLIDSCLSSLPNSAEEGGGATVSLSVVLNPEALEAERREEAGGAAERIIEETLLF